MVKPNFFKAIATGVIIWRVFKYIGVQKRLLETWDYKIRELRLVGFGAGELKFQLAFDFYNNSGVSIRAGLFDFDTYIDGIRVGRAINNDFVDIQPYSTVPVYFDLRVKPKDLGAAGQKLINSINKIGSIPVRLVGQFSTETLPGVYKTVPVDFTDTAANLFFGE
jgi:LEA14-like dessication related protein